MVFKNIDFIAFKLLAPIIGHIGWEDIINKQMKNEVVLQRLMKVNDDYKSTDYEAMVYLHTASLAFPFNETWFNIYTYLFNNFYKDNLPEDMKNIGVKELNSLEIQELDKLKKWIYKQQVYEFKRKKEQEITVIEKSKLRELIESRKGITRRKRRLE